MANRPLAYTLTERKATIGAMAGKTVLQARPSRTATCRRNCETTCGKRRHRRVWRHRYAYAIFPEQNRGEG